MRVKFVLLVAMLVCAPVLATLCWYNALRSADPAGWRTAAILVLCLFVSAMGRLERRRP